MTTVFGLRPRIQGVDLQLNAEGELEGGEDVAVRDDLRVGPESKRSFCASDTFQPCASLRSLYPRRAISGSIREKTVTVCQTFSRDQWIASPSRAVTIRTLFMGSGETWSAGGIRTVSHPRAR